MFKEAHRPYVYLGFDDTDIKNFSRGTGRCIRDFCATLDDSYKLECVLRHQLPKLSDIPYTSNNSSACAILSVESIAVADNLFHKAIEFLTRETPEGSDPGVCLAVHDAIDDRLISFALECTDRKKSQTEAIAATSSVSLAGVGGTHDGIIGAAAAVGLTRYGWSGRFIELGNMRSLPPVVSVAELSRLGIHVVSVDRDPLVPLAPHMVNTGGWLRPSLWAGQPVLQVYATGDGQWSTALEKKSTKSTVS